MTEMLEMQESVTTDVDSDDGILRIALNRPDKRNAFDLNMIRAFTRIIDTRSSDTRAVVISGGPFFCAGADIAVYARGDIGEIAELTRAAGLLVEAISTVPVPVLAAVEGMALGGGFEVALAADIVVAGESAKLGLPEVSLGLIPGWGGTQRLAAQIGSRRAKQLIMLQQRLTAADALELGLVNEVVPKGGSLDRALELARLLSSSSATALAATKHLVSGVERALAYDDERATLMGLFTSRDGLEGVAAFVEKRPPNFGR